ncbi:hypothetical protein CGMCC3_g13758 [Colletotrichum fructicola]|nr:uncharacterized protein CGMCC3_g13758 [Colletotrichum fructicola]KAE9570133.1 hypothetical protein CGMCC3_g13758 [Colletotrichum fructicola]
MALGLIRAIPERLAFIKWLTSPKRRPAFTMREGTHTDGPPALDSSHDEEPTRPAEEELPDAEMASPSAMTDPKAENASFSPMEDSREVRDLKERLQEVESKIVCFLCRGFVNHIRQFSK